jgi:3-deoxy-manno-octulosonate cytidylyltransferase (CMP-KDO synthetase)
MSKNIAIIPARYDSTRFPGKLLEKIGEKTILNLVWDQVTKSTQLDEIIIATDDERIITVAENFGAQAELTFRSHKSGTDRCAQIAARYWENDVVINVQADEPFIKPELIDMIVEKMNQDEWIEIASLYTKIVDSADILDPNVVKIVKDNSGKALYFSRASIPFYRDGIKSDYNYLRHIGLYAYRNKVLQSITKLEESLLEEAEKLEQLRWIENGFTLHVFETEYQGIGIDTPEDLERAKIMI